MPGRRTPRKTQEITESAHLQNAFKGALDGASAIPSPVVAGTNIQGKQAAPSVHFFQDRFIAYGGSQELYLTYVPMAFSEHVYVLPRGEGTRGRYQLERVAWKRGSKANAVQVLGAMNTQSGDVIVVEYAYHAQNLAGGATCGNFPLLVPAMDGTLKELGPSLPDYTEVMFTAPFLKVAINGDDSGALGGFTGEPYEYAIRFDPKGSGDFSNYWDFLSPGSPEELFMFHLVDSGGNERDIIGSNQGGTHTADVWVLDNNRHCVVKIGDAASGWVVVQYIIDGPVICMNMQYTNTTNSTQIVQASRLLDPDQDYNYTPGGTYDTTNYVGYGGKSKSTNATAVGLKTRFVVELDALPGSYPTAAHVCDNWDETPMHILENDGVVDYDYADDSIGVAWDIGAVARGQSVNVQCMYTFSTL